MKKLYRSRKNRKLAGVIGGLADYTGWDVTLLRILFALGVIIGYGSLALIYLIWIFVVPDEEGTTY
ncbi:PspC domain-containing protein [Bacillus songklensis]|uniref:PspC domain-containing protein n=1 Tax=Bacillus songklensis TaxID=1069116 RepID=A0ABV8B889_9BACI